MLRNLSFFIFSKYFVTPLPLIMYHMLDGDTSTISPLFPLDSFYSIPLLIFSLAFPTNFLLSLPLIFSLIPPLIFYLALLQSSPLFHLLIFYFALPQSFPLFPPLIFYLAILKSFPLFSHLSST